VRNHSAKAVALGGVLGALAVVIMCLGGLIPVATFVCPMLCCLLLYFVKRFCDSRIGWAWYALVCLLSILMGPDKEAAAVFLMIGYYPLIKNQLDSSRFRLLWKLLIFNVSVLVMYSTMIHLLGMAELAAEYAEFGFVGGVVTVLLGNVTFFMLDRLLALLDKRK